MDLVCDLFGSWSSVGGVELDTKVGVGSTGVVRGGQEDTTVRLVLSDESGDGRCGENGVLADDHLGDSVGSSNSQDDLHGFGRLRQDASA